MRHPSKLAGADELELAARQRDGGPLSTGRRHARDAAGQGGLLRVVDFGFAAIAIVAPCFMGGRHPLGQLVLVACALLVGCAWLLRQTLSTEQPVWRRSPADILLLLGIGLVVLQLTPLSSELLRLASPRIGTLLPLWSGGSGPGQLGHWASVSLCPGETASGLINYLAYALIFLVAVQRVETLRDVERILQYIAVSAVLMAAIGLAQYLVGNGRFLWVYQHPFRDTHDAVKGTFINQNHFAHLLALGTAPLIWWLERSLAGRSTGEIPARAMLLVVALGGVLFAGLMSFSRGGALMIATATLLSAYAALRAQTLNRRLIVALVVVCITLGVALTIHGSQRVGQRLGDYVSGNLADLDRNAVRRNLWSADLQVAKDFWVLGSGVGTHAFVYPLEYAENHNVEFTNAENGYIQLLLETGLPGLTLLLAGAAMCGLWCASGLRVTQSRAIYSCLVAVSVGLVVSLLHSLGDFVWYLPALAAITVLLAACACRLHQLARHSAGLPIRRSFVLPQWLPLGALSGLMLLGYWMLSDRLAEVLATPAWERYLTRALAPGQSGPPSSEADRLNAADLQEVIRYYPNHARAHLRLAQVYLRQFQREQERSPNVMPLNQIRDTVIQSRRKSPAGFATRDDLAHWMARAFGEHSQLLFAANDACHRGLALCPLLGEGYAYQTDLCFLDGADARTVDALVEQARLVRPHSPEVLTIAGEVAALRGRHDEMIACWRPVLRTESISRSEIAERLARFHVPLPFVVEAFEPNLSACRLLIERYAAHDTPENQMSPLLERFTKLAEREIREGHGEWPPRSWLELHQVYARMEDERRATAALERGLKQSPNAFDLRRAAGLWYVQLEHYDQAEQHLQWCLQRRPGDRQLGQQLEVAVRGRVAAGGTAQTREPKVRKSAR